MKDRKKKELECLKDSLDLILKNAKANNYKDATIHLQNATRSLDELKCVNNQIDMEKQIEEMIKIVTTHYAEKIRSQRTSTNE